LFDLKKRKQATVLNMKAKVLTLALAFGLATVVGVRGVESTSGTEVKKPNILVIIGDDIGCYNPSCYSHGDMDYLRGKPRQA
jgi:hypothetical protein